MLRSAFNVVTDGQYGSCGKGAVTTSLAYKYRPDVISTTNMANAGHTAVNVDGEKFIAKALPSATVLHKWTNKEYNPLIAVGPSAAFDLIQLMKEYNDCQHPQLLIHPRAGVILEKHKQAEQQTDGGTKHIASTMQGCGSFLSDKVMRKPDCKLARDYPDISEFMPQENFSLSIIERIMSGEAILHEGSQGFSLCINHGSHYPQCTSRSTTAVQNLADMGIPATMMGDVYLVIRPYPIRVGNVVEEGKIVGHSGGCYEDHEEISWEEVAKNAGAPLEEMSKELTTVTKRLRRVFTLSKQQLKEAVAINGATKIALNFANYIDWSCYGVNEFDRLPIKVLDFIKMLENLTQIPVAMVGTGPQINHMCYAD